MVGPWARLAGRLHLDCRLSDYPLISQSLAFTRKEAPPFLNSELTDASENMRSRYCNGDIASPLSACKDCALYASPFSSGHRIGTVTHRHLRRLCLVNERGSEGILPLLSFGGKRSDAFLPCLSALQVASVWLHQHPNHTQPHHTLPSFTFIVQGPQVFLSHCCWLAFLGLSRNVYLPTRALGFL